MVRTHKDIIRRHALRLSLLTGLPQNLHLTALSILRNLAKGQRNILHFPQHDPLHFYLIVLPAKEIVEAVSGCSF